ncbi:MAG: S1 RNA-binding domain-containing protein [Acidimicrobiales bacterium]
MVLDYKGMPIEHIIVDGSNIATEGRSLPSLKQLEEAVAELRRDHPDAEITVIVDATFAHRIDPSELARFEQAAMRGEYVHPPAGAIGRGDAFLLRVAEKVDGTVLSNDSFQEFHGEHPWLFERGRLLGATPVPGIGWIFSPRQPVRGPKSHQAVRESEQAKKRVTKAIAVATKEVVEPAGKPAGPGPVPSGSRKRPGGAPAAEKAAAGSRERDKPTPLAVNDPLAFISFIAEHRLGEQFEGEVEGYTSHGAVVLVGEMRCYIPLANLGDPAPRSAREVLKRHQRGQFVLTALDPQRRGAELALPGIAYVSGHPREETVAAEVRLARSARKAEVQTEPKAVKPAGKKAAAKLAVAKMGEEKAAPAKVASSPAKPVAAEPAPRRTTARKAPSKKAARPAKLTTEKAPAKRLATARKAPSGRRVAEKAVLDKAPAKKAPPSKARAPRAPAARPLAPEPGAKKVAAKAPAGKSRAQDRPAKRTSAAKAAASPTKAGAASEPGPVVGRKSPRTTASTR